MWRRQKYGAKRTASGFPSKLEAAVYERLKIREGLGEISDIKRQQTVVLQDGPKEMRIAWKVDFSFIDNESGKMVLAEAKGVATMDFKIKLKLYRKIAPYRLEIWRGDYRRPKVTEVIEALV